MRYGIEVVEEVGEALPVTLEDLKLHLHEDGTMQDLLLLGTYLPAAIAAVEDQQARVLQKSRLRLHLERWPVGRAISIPRYPVQEVESITYLEEGEEEPTVLPASSYQLVAQMQPPAVVLKRGESWPSAVIEAGAPIAVTFVAGYEDGEVPAKPRQAIQLLAAHWYANRESVVVGSIATEIPEGLRSLVLADRLW